MPEISQGTIEQAIQTTGDTVLRNELYFCDLDGLAGDGDFGNSLASGFRAIKAEWDAIPKTDIGAMLLKISMIVSKTVGGSSGPIWGTGFMKAAMLTRGKTEVTLPELAEMVGSAIEGIQARGGVLTGEAAVRANTNQGLVVGDMVNTAARLQSVAPPGAVLVGEATYRAASRATRAPGSSCP